MKKLSKAAAIAFVLSLAFLLPVGCKTNPTGETSSEENSSSESVPDVDSSVQTPDETPTLPDDTPEPPDDTPQPEPEPEPPAKSYASYIKCTRDGVNIRAGAGTEFPVLGSAEKDTAYVVAGKTGNWYKTYYKNQTRRSRGFHRGGVSVSTNFRVIFISASETKVALRKGK